MNRRILRVGRMAAALITAWLATAPLIASAVPISGTVDFEALDGQPLSVGLIAGGTITFHNVQGSGVNVTFSVQDLWRR